MRPRWCEKVGCFGISALTQSGDMGNMRFTADGTPDEPVDIFDGLRRVAGGNSRLLVAEARSRPRLAAALGEKRHRRVDYPRRCDSRQPVAGANDAFGAVAGLAGV